MSHSILSNLQGRLDVALQSLREELAKKRTGRSNPSVVEDVSVEIYNTQMAVKELAAISVPEPHQLRIAPWDTSVLENLEKALLQADLGAAPVVDGESIRIDFPSLTTERREILVREVNELVEEAKKSFRAARQDARKATEKLEITEGEDFVFRLEEKVEEVMTQFNLKLENLQKNKEAEIRA